MKTIKLFTAAIVLLGSSAAANAGWFNGFATVNNVCTNGSFFTTYAPYQAQPVGSACTVFTPWGAAPGWVAP